jgi:hypothetical protein
MEKIFDQIVVMMTNFQRPGLDFRIVYIYPSVNREIFYPKEQSLVPDFPRQ